MRPLLTLVRERAWPAHVARCVDVWVHGVSVGEVEVASTFVSALRECLPRSALLFTSSTPAGTALLRKKYSEEAANPFLAVRAFPLDLPFSVRRLMNSARPKLLALMETEIWPIFLREAKSRNIPVLIVNARLSEGSFRRLSKARWLFEPSLQAISLIAARSDEDAARFERLGVPRERIEVAGDLKFDRPSPPRPVFETEFRSLAGSRPVLVAGSVATEELDLVLAAFQKIQSRVNGLFLLLAPRRTEAFDLAARKLATMGLAFVRRSRLSEGGPRETSVFLLDSIGELASSYLLGTAALLGGTFAPKGGHNILEPLQAGLAVIHGPSIANIRRTVTDAAGAAFEARGADDAAALLSDILSSSERQSRAREQALALIQRNRGAASRAARMAIRLLPAVA